MNYFISTTIAGLDFNEVVIKITKVLNDRGFGILNQIDLSAIFKKKLDKDFKKYLILSACNPSFAFEGLRIEDKLGILLPCNVVVIEQGEGLIEVAAVDPVVVMQSVNNEQVKPLAIQVRDMIAEAFTSLK